MSYHVLVEAPDHKLELVATDRGRYWLPTDRPGDVIVQAMRRGDVFEPHIVELARRYIRPGTVVLDVGACFGQMSIEFSRLVGPGGEVHAFEADEFVHSILERNLEANGCRNVRSYQRAVFDVAGLKKFYPVPDFSRFESYGSYGLDPRAKAGRQVETISIDSIGIDRPISFMKVDVQGSDLFVLRGAIETIRAWRMPIVFEFEEQFQAEFKTSLADYLAFVREVRYRVEEIVAGINYVIVPEERPREGRLVSAWRAARGRLDRLIGRSDG